MGRNVRHNAASMAVLAILLSACSSVPRSGGYYQNDGPDDRPRDVSNVPDAVPRDEPYRPANLKPYAVSGVTYTPLTNVRGYRERGVASWYGKQFHGNPTASGEAYDMYAMTAAHRTLPLPSYVRVTNLQNGRSVVVRVNDRGPFLHNRLIDLSYAAAGKLGVIGTGTAMVEVEDASPGATTVAERSSVPVANAVTADRPTPRLTVQVGAFSRFENAATLRDRLLSAGFNPIQIEPIAPGATNPLYRVRIGPVASIEQGDRLVADVGRHGIADALLIVE
jgi:rare lipoprotein A